MTATFTLHPRFLECAACDGEGRDIRPRLGGNDPDTWDAGPCPECGGSGNGTCGDCGWEPAIAEWAHDGRTSRICMLCHERWLKEGEE